MFARLFRLRASLKSFASPAARVSLAGFEYAPPSADGRPGGAHSDYNGRPLRTRELEHFVEDAADGERFNVH